MPAQLQGHDDDDSRDLSGLGEFDGLGGTVVLWYMHTCVQVRSVFLLLRGRLWCLAAPGWARETQEQDERDFEVSVTPGCRVPGCYLC